MRILKKFRLAAAVLIVIVSAYFVVYLLRGGFRQFEIAPYKVSLAAFTNWRHVLSHPRDISIATFQTGVAQMDACLNLDPKSPKQTECDHRPRDLAVLVHWVHHPRFGDFLIDTGFDNSFAKHPPYGNYAEAMKLFNGPVPLLLTGDASHFEWAFQAVVAPRGWNQAGTARGHQSLAQQRNFTRAYPSIRLVEGHERRSF